MKTQFDNLGDNEIDPNTEYYVCSFYKSKRFTILMKHAIIGDCESIEKYLDTLKSIESSQLIKQVINEKNEHGFTPLMLACRNVNTCSNIETIQILLNNGADVNLQDNDGDTALMHSSGQEPKLTSINVSVVKLLLQHKTNPNLVDISGRTSLLYMSGRPGNFNYEIAKLLLEHGADPNIQENFGATPLQFATNYSWDDTMIETVKLLLKYKADVNLTDKQGNTPFVLAFDELYDVTHEESHIKLRFPPPKKRNNKEILKLLLLAKTDINLITKKEISEMDIIEALRN